MAADLLLDDPLLRVVHLPGDCEAAAAHIRKHRADCGNIVALEHVNINIEHQDLAQEFYVEALGFTRDPYSRVSGRGTMWINVGTQQIHLPVCPPAQTVNGVVNLVVPCLEDLRDRLEKVKAGGLLKGTKYAFRFVVEAERQYAFVTGPAGNLFRMCDSRDPQEAQIPRPFKLYMPSIHVNVKEGVCEGLARFYSRVFSAPVTLTKAEGAVSCAVVVGPGQALVYEERAGTPDQEGWHVCVYVSRFAETYRRCQALGVAWNNPRFSDRVHCLDDALQEMQFRIKDLVDPGELGEDSGPNPNAPDPTVLLTLEHEVRSMTHPSYLRPLVNRLEQRL